MIEEHCYKPGDQVQSGNHVYRLEKFDYEFGYWVARQEQNGLPTFMLKPFTFVKHIGPYVRGEKC